MQPIDFLYAGREKNPAAIALQTAQASLTYQDLVAEVEALAAAFQDLDPAPASRVGICAWNTREHLVALLAAYAAGKVWVPLNPRNGKAELAAMIAATTPGLLLDEAELLDGVPAGQARRIATSEIASLVGRYAGKKPHRLERGGEEPQVIKFSGGSTGKPKAVVQPVRCINAQARGILSAFEFRSDDVNLVAAPLTHGTSCFVLPIFAAGGRHVLLGKLPPGEILQAFQRYGVTTVYLPPTLIYLLLAEPSRTSYPALRHMIYSAAPMPPERIREARSAFGPVLETAYGQVEAPQIVTAMRAADFADPENLTSVGRVVPPTRVAIVDPGGRHLPAGEIGEVVVSGDLVMSGYLDQPDLTAGTLVDGWLHTGDLGLLDERGYLYLRGRSREVIISGGFNIFPADVEAVLCRHPAVMECCVFGASDPKWGEAVHAAVKLAPGAEAGEADLIAFVKRELDSVKAPKRIHFLAALPHNSVGKVSRGDVRDIVSRSRRPPVTPSERSE